jgi:two-component system sensor histidine kinase UhpB
VHNEPAQAGVAQQLRASEELFFKAFHVNPDPMVITRKADGVVLEANEAFARKYGVSCAEARGKTALELGVWKNLEERDELLRQLDASGSLHNREKTTVLPTGQVTVGLVSIESLVIQGEDCLLTVSNDITDQRQAERDLRASEERYRKFIALSAEGIARFDFEPPIPVSLSVPEQLAAILRTGVVAECNDAAARVRGWSTARDLQGKRVGELNQTTDPVNRLNISHFIESGYSIVDGVTLGRDAFGSDRWFLNNAVGVVRDGFLHHIWTVQRDITERVLAERALRASEERFELAVRGSNDGLWDWDVQTNEVFYSERFRELLGYSSPADFPPLVETFLSQLHPGDKDRIWAAVQEHLTRRKPYDVEYRLRTRSGLYRWYRARGQAVWNETGRPVRMAGSITDIHDHRMAEEGLREAQEQALAASKVFTHRLISAQEQERKRLANELHDSLGQNLSLIKNRADLALRQPGVSPDTTAHLRAIAEVVTAAIDEVRNLARNLRPLHVDQFGLTDAVNNLLDRVAQATELRLERRIENIDIFRGEEATHVYRIIQETLNNVLKHARALRVLVVVERDVRCTRIRVEDDGSGFDVAAVGRPGNRTGIGLTSIGERVRMLGGSLELQSAPGQGTRLHIELPLADIAPLEP